MNPKTIDTIVKIVDTLKAQGYPVPKDVIGSAALAKTVVHYEFALSQAIRDLYNTGDIGAYIDRHAGLIEEQFTRAWNEGMREAGIDPKEMTEEERETLQREITMEENYVLDFAAEILLAAAEGKPVSPFVSRASVWANRYNSVMNMAKVMAAGNKKMKWVLGPTEHCGSCFKLSGIIKRASTWERAGIRPQNAPNPMLECGGWNCQCQLVFTTEPARRGPFPKLP